MRDGGLLERSWGVLNASPLPPRGGIARRRRACVWSRCAHAAAERCGVCASTGCWLQRGRDNPGVHAATTSRSSLKYRHYVGHRKTTADCMSAGRCSDPRARKGTTTHKSHRGSLSRLRSESQWGRCPLHLSITSTVVFRSTVLREGNSAAQPDPAATQALSWPSSEWSTLKILVGAGSLC